MATKNTHKKLGNRIKHAISLTGELNKNIAKKAGCQPTELSRWIRGEAAPTYNKLASIARACKLSGDQISWLFDGKGNAPDYSGNKKEEIFHTKADDLNQKSSSQNPTPLEERKDMDLLSAKDEIIKGLNSQINLLLEKISLLEAQLGGKSGARKKVNGN